MASKQKQRHQSILISNILLKLKWGAYKQQPAACSTRGDSLTNYPGIFYLQHVIACSSVMLSRAEQQKGINRGGFCMIGTLRKLLLHIPLPHAQPMTMQEIIQIRL